MNMCKYLDFTNLITAKLRKITANDEKQLKE
jgi:hypothetical protein